MSKDGGVLKDHKRVGKRFIPPMLQLPNWQEVSYINQIFPHLVWMGLINDRLGYREGVALSIDFGKLAHSIHKAEKNINFAICGSYSLLSQENKSAVVKLSKEKGWLPKLQRALAPMTVHYSEFPLTFLGLGDTEIAPKVLLKELKQCVARHLNKYEAPSLVLQANLLAIRAATGGISFAQHIELPDLDAIITAPDSDKAKRAGAFVRASALSEWMPGKPEVLEQWSRSFWNQGYKIDTCMLVEEANGDRT